MDGISQALVRGEPGVNEVVAVLTQAGWKLAAILAQGGPVMVPLLASSVISLVVTLERCLFWRGLRAQEGGETVLALVAAGRLERAMQVARGSWHPVSRVLLAGLEHHSPAPGLAMMATSQAELHRLKRSLSMLDTIITLAPLLGLLGTVTGMISAFGLVSEVGLGQPHAITGGVAEALIATATGLSIAILSLLPYNYFRARTETVTNLIEERATRLELLLKAHQEQEAR
jgi:biopolymer transport protein ExbB